MIFIHLCQIKNFADLCWTCESQQAARRRHCRRGVLLESFTSCGVINLLMPIGPWRTAICTYLSSLLFFNYFSFIRPFEDERDGMERRTGGDIHKGHKTISSPWCCLLRSLISSEHLSLRAWIQAPCVNGSINICIHVHPVSCNPFQDRDEGHKH